MRILNTKGKPDVMSKAAKTLIKKRSTNEVPPLPNGYWAKAYPVLQRQSGDKIGWKPFRHRKKPLLTDKQLNACLQVPKAYSRRMKTFFNKNQNGQSGV